MYKVGDVVMIVSEEHMRSHFTRVEPHGCYRTPGDLFINDMMSQFCGEETAIRSLNIYGAETRYRVVGNSWLWDDYCFEEVKQFDFSGLEDLL